MTLLGTIANLALIPHDMATTLAGPAVVAGGMIGGAMVGGRRT
jgi:hypothetical protein